MTTPLPITSTGFCLTHGRTGLGSRIWLNTLTTESAVPAARAATNSAGMIIAHATASHFTTFVMDVTPFQQSDQDRQEGVLTPNCYAAGLKNLREKHGSRSRKG